MACETGVGKSSLGGTAGGASDSSLVGTGGGRRVGRSGRALIGVLMADAKLSTVLDVALVSITGRVGASAGCAAVSITSGLDWDAEFNAPTGGWLGSSRVDAGETGDGKVESSFDPPMMAAVTVVGVAVVVDGTRRSHRGGQS